MLSVTELTINGRSQRVEAEPGESLLFVLRDRLHLTSAKYGCGEGRCGACTVLVDGRVTKACVTELAKCAGKNITTVESLADGEHLHPLQQAFIDCGAMQCGYCTTGMIMCAVGLLQGNPDPKPAEVRSFMDGNLCRCGTYSRIETAICQAAAAMKGGVR